MSLLHHIQLSKGSQGSGSPSQALEHNIAPMYANLAGKTLYDFTQNVCLSSVLQYPNSWIIDTGANDRMCYQRHMFMNLTALQTYKVSLPNGEFVEVLYSGKVMTYE